MQKTMPISKLTCLENTLRHFSTQHQIDYIHFNSFGWISSLLFSWVFCQDLHVISTDENRVVAAVQEWNQNDTYNLYVSDTSGIYYTLALEDVVSSIGPEGNVMVDLYEVRAHHY